MDCNITDLTVNSNKEPLLVANVVRQTDWWYVEGWEWGGATSASALNKPISHTSQTALKYVVKISDLV